jgi:SAM-dependent methyltransferase
MNSSKNWTAAYLFVAAGLLAPLWTMASPANSCLYVYRNLPDIFKPNQSVELEKPYEEKIEISSWRNARGDRISKARIQDERGIKFARTDRGEREVHFEQSFSYFQNLLSIEALTGKRVLDAGCGKQAVYARWLKKNGIDVYGIDLSVQKDNENFLFNMDLTKTSFKNDTFDVTISTQSAPTYFINDIQTLGNRYQLHRALKELTRITKIGGYILIGGTRESSNEFADEILRHHSSLVKIDTWQGSWVLKKVK